MSWLTRWFRGRARPSAEETVLLARCHGDRALLERLVAAEMARRPSQSRAAASRAALERWNRDR